MSFLNTDRKILSALPFVLLFLCFLTSGVLAATGEKTRATVYLSSNNWKTDADTLEHDLNQLVFGLNAIVLPSDKIRLQIDGTLAGSSLDGRLPGGSTLDESFSSLNDTRIRLSYRNPQATTTIIANLPTGKTKLTADEYAAAAVLADNGRKFLVRRVGQGFDIGIEGMSHPRVGDATLLFGGSYLHKGKFRVREIDSLDYKYGDEISGTVGFNYDASPLRGGVSGTVIYYFRDKIGDQEEYQAGLTQYYQGSITYSRDFEVYGGLNLLLRGKAKRRSGEKEFTEEQTKSSRNEVQFYAGGDIPVTDRFTAAGQIEYLNVSESDYDPGSALYRPSSSYFGIGGGGSMQLTEILYLSGMITLYTGSVDSKSALIPDSDLSGFSFLLALTVRTP